MSSTDTILFYNNTPLQAFSSVDNVDIDKESFMDIFNSFFHI